MGSRTVAKRFDGTWTNKITGANKPTTLHKTMEEAIAEAKRMLVAAGGGELHIKVNYKTQVEVVSADRPLPGPSDDGTRADKNRVR